MLREQVESWLEALSKAAPNDLTEAVVDRTREAAEQFAEFAAGFLGWSGEIRESVRREVRERMHAEGWVEGAGLVTRKDLEALRARVDDLAARLEALSKSRSGSSRGTGAAKATTRARASAGRSTPASRPGRGASSRSTGAGRSGATGTGSRARGARRAASGETAPPDAE